MLTNNVDLAAYFILRGLKPGRVTVGRRSFRTYEFPDATAKPLAKAYWEDATVPVRTFSRVRAELKKVEASMAGAEALEIRRTEEESRWSQISTDSSTDPVDRSTDNSTDGNSTGGEPS